MSADAGVPTARSSAAKVNKKFDRIARAIEKLRSVLTTGEVVRESVFQLRLWALTHRRSLLATTDRRIIFFRRGLLGGFDMTDFQWQDVRNAHVKEHFFPAILGADLIIVSTEGRRMEMAGLDSDKARKIYAFAQAQEQAWREKNRIREIEELRAKSGGITLNGAGSPIGAPAAAPARAEDMSKKLKEAKELLDCGAISDVEFETIKARFLNNI
jgi:hypothetical protein